MWERVEAADWRNRTTNRSRQFDADEVALVERIKALGASDGLLGHADANKCLRQLNSGFADRLANTGA